MMNRYGIYTVAKGDTLWSIAKRMLGSAARYVDIVRLNKLKTSVLYPGQQLQILDGTENSI